MPTLSKPENYEGDCDAESDYAWDELASAQLSRESWGVLDEGDVLALLDRNCITEEWSRRCFVLIDTDHAYIFDEQGIPIHDPGNFVTMGCQPLHGAQGFYDEFDGGKGDDYKAGIPQVCRLNLRPRPKA